MKIFLKKILPEGMKHWFWLFRRNFRRAWADRVYRIPFGGGRMSAFTHAVQATLKEGIDAYARLDYPAPILMSANSFIELYRLTSCRKEPETIAWLEKRIEPGDILYDVGANVGAYALLAAARGAGRVIAFEPDPHFHALLSKNIARNRFEHTITPLAVCLAEKTGMNEKAPHVRMTLDECVRVFQLPGPHHIKIDVDGDEHLVLSGASRTLASPTLRSLLIEINEKIGSDAKARIFEVLDRSNFSLVSLHLERTKGRAGNYIFVKRSHADV